MAAKQIICDTDVMIDYWYEANSRHANTKTFFEEKIGLDNICISAITKIELLVGAVNKTDLAKINKNLDSYNILLLNNDISLSAFSLIQKYSLSHNLALADGLIAATAIFSDLELFTYNTKDYKFISELKLFKH